MVAQDTSSLYINSSQKRHTIAMDIIGSELQGEEL